MTTWVGCSGWSYEDWKGRLYDRDLPSSRWLERYADVFDTVEINSSFYRLPTRKAAETWAASTPPGFCFAVKVSRYGTHLRRLREAGATLATLHERIEPLAATGKLGPILWQLPANFHRDDERLARALDELPPGRHAFEFRHESWFVPEVYDVLRRHGAAFVLAHSATRPLPEGEPTTDWSYIRLHHGRRGRRGNYSERELREWTKRIEALEGDVFVYLNNDWEGFAVANALRLRELLGAHAGLRASARGQSDPRDQTTEVGDDRQADAGSEEEHPQGAGRRETEAHDRAPAREHPEQARRGGRKGTEARRRGGARARAAQPAAAVRHRAEGRDQGPLEDGRWELIDAIRAAR